LSRIAAIQPYRGLAIKPSIVETSFLRHFREEVASYMPSSSPNNGNGLPRVSRRLAAIAFVDVVGYSILMAREETRTHLAWIATLENVIRPQTIRHGGTIVKSTGDGILAEFPSALDAVEWAQKVQRSMASLASNEGQQSSIVLRIAVHLGDIITTDYDVFGDGVNVGARLQEYAPPGGVILSEAIYDLVRGSVGARARDLGFLELKNFDRPVRAYAINPDAQGIILPPRPHQNTLPSIAVLPLQNLGGDPADEYFSDGIVEDITLSLAGLRELTVISRGSTLAYRGRPPDPREVGRGLGVRYVMTGSVRRSERAVRVSMELCDATTGATLWGEQAEVPLGELFDIQDRIVRRIVAGIAPNVRAAELRAAMRKRPGNFTAYDYTLKALHVIHSLDAGTFRQAREFLNQAMAEDPNFAMPVAWAARWHSLYVGQGWSANPSEDGATAIELAAKAIDLEPENALALVTFGHLKSFLFHDYDSAMIYLERALAAGPNNSIAWLLSSPTLSYIGRGEQAVSHAEHALRLSPMDRSLFYYYTILSLAYYGAGQFEEAVKWGKRAASENPPYTATLRYLAAALAALDRVGEARNVATELLRREPGFRLRDWERRLQPFQDPGMGARYMEHLRKAGLLP
jgi:TolB-like protein/class 3 adenylate cyclase